MLAVGCALRPYHVSRCCTAVLNANKQLQMYWARIKSGVLEAFSCEYLFTRCSNSFSKLFIVISPHAAAGELIPIPKLLLVPIEEEEA